MPRKHTTRASQQLPTSTFEIPGFQTVEQAALTLNCSVSTVWRRIAARGITTTRLLGRTVLALADVERMRDSNGDRTGKGGETQ